MTIEAGKKYVRRDGKVTEILALTSSENLFDSRFASLYEPSWGGFYWKGKTDCRDLMAEFREDTPVTTDSKPDEVFIDLPFPAGLEPYRYDVAIVKDRIVTIDELLEFRGKNYGDFKDHAQITQDIKEIMTASRSWKDLNASQREALEMIAHKMARILNGNVAYVDSWTDICGYARLGEEETKKLEGGKCQS